MKIQTRIEKKLLEELKPLHLELINESHQHNVPEGSESHFKLVVVSTLFLKKPLLERHRTINTILSEELKNDIHALAIHAMTPDEWEARTQRNTDSPPCMGGSSI
ncbi:MAG: BolA protein [Chlamydiales bacterium]|jgi:BolA protein